MMTTDEVALLLSIDLISILTQRAGGKVTVSMEELENVHNKSVDYSLNPDDTITITVSDQAKKE